MKQSIVIFYRAGSSQRGLYTLVFAGLFVTQPGACRYPKGLFVNFRLEVEELVMFGTGCLSSLFASQECEEIILYYLMLSLTLNAKIGLIRMTTSLLPHVCHFRTVLTYVSSEIHANFNMISRNKFQVYCKYSFLLHLTNLTT